MNLSICVPTFNRYQFLKWTLDRCTQDFPDAEIIISDNASTDGTAHYWSDTQKVTHRPNNIGPFENLREALLLAKSKYCCYLGDDDYLLPEQVKAGIDYLELHPGVICYYAPCQLYDEVAKEVNWNAFYVANDQTFHSAEKLWNFLIHNHVWPEHAIWRRDGLENILKQRTRAYWAFIDLANAFAKGPVHFAHKPYYRNITNHPIGHRVKLGDRQCLTDFDEYRSGLEILAYELFKNNLSAELKLKLNQMIQHFINMRIAVAHKLLVAQGEMQMAQDYERRLAICG